MKKIITILTILFIIAGCGTSEQDNNIEIETKDLITSNNGNLYQDWCEIPILTDNSYFDFYLENKVEENHSELICTNNYQVSDMLYRFEYYQNDEETFTLKESLFGLDDGIKYDEMFQTRSYDMSVVKDESYWFDYDDNGEIIGCSLSVMEYGNHAPYVLSSFYDVETDKLECDRNDLTSEYADNGEAAIKSILSTFVKETIDVSKLIKDFETDLYFYYEDLTNDYKYYVGPNSLQLNLLSIDTDENGRYIKAYLASGNDGKLYIDDNYRIIKIDMYAYNATYEYLDNYVVATYDPKNGEAITYKYDYQRNQIIE